MAKGSRAISEPQSGVMICERMLRIWSQTACIGRLGQSRGEPEIRT